MIIKVTWNDNDFYNELEKVAFKLGKRFENYLTYGTIEEHEIDLSASLDSIIKNIEALSSGTYNNTDDDNEVSRRARDEQFKRWDFKTHIIKALALDELTKEDIKQLNTLLHNCVLEIIDKELKIPSDTKEYLKKNLKVKIVKSYQDKWENSESAYLILKGLSNISGLIIQ